ncbi:hypothetical protein SEA_GOBY_69 [Streptomyces phage Goby]|uniref:DUF7417 domain-containing protein n=3 Tax=Likavirus TaxID=1982880 RepID=A0A1C9LWT9_9CAUD|nr:hypothetical protein M050_gp69 [Streptomyces phage Sujidade]YP_010056622.1 hypothetical protein KGH00_gp69 [Streptomyces phage Goby]AOQ27044.1 hypothetical protein SEA_GODPOWER_69 [Streptomyces phage Godpower]AWN07663.1 hypothetical protein SEA_TOMA_69 [Streptomyces phage Toma]AGM12167.1 hypothetical protein SUJIDADE_69 [Streptomyces phage Sujidade]AWN07587.1 hypothetical protein SEA_GOBY_69 [Streptomyces phage Goby]
MSKMGNLVVELIDYESGNLDDAETLDLFGRLVKSGFAWSLQGSYGRTAQALINEGWISETGEVLATP